MLDEIYSQIWSIVPYFCIKAWVLTNSGFLLIILLNLYQHATTASSGYGAAQNPDEHSISAWTKHRCARLSATSFSPPLSPQWAELQSYAAIYAGIYDEHRQVSMSYRRYTAGGLYSAALHHQRYRSSNPSCSVSIPIDAPESAQPPEWPAPREYHFPFYCAVYRAPSCFYHNRSIADFSIRRAAGPSANMPSI